ncbi:hypothetical protein KIPB_004270, partial [Kipferlia bialata]|eukprot:g4270.t1
MPAATMNLDYYNQIDVNKVVTMKYGTKNQSMFFGCGAIEKFATILETVKPSCVGFITSKSAYHRCGAWAPI